MNQHNENVWVKEFDRSELAARPGLGGRWKRFVQPSQRNLGMIVGLGELAPGETLLWQQHALPEVFCVLLGQVEVHWRESERERCQTLGPRQMFYLARRTPHDLRNSGREPLLLLFFKIEPAPSQPAAAAPHGEVAFARTFQPADLVSLPDIRGRWKRYVLPSPDNFGMIVGLGELPSRTRMGWHTHADPEIFYVLDGQGLAHWEWEGIERSEALRPGRAFYKVGNVRHDMEASGDELLLGVAFKVRAPL